MNIDDIKTLNEKYKKDFKKALDIYENDYSHEEIINFLKNGDIVEKQIAALKLDNINSQEDADILMSNLTECDGKIREAVSFRLKEFVSENPQFFTKYTATFLDAIIDINGNICRNTLSALAYLKNFPEFCNNFSKKLIEKAFLLSQKKYDIQEGKYKINKDIFKLYWYLETIYLFSDFVDGDKLLSVLEQTQSIPDYTIREKSAKILSNLNNPKFEGLKAKLKKDENYYVRRF